MKLLEFFSGAGNVGKSECDFVFEQSQGLILVKSECDFCGVVLGGGGQILVSRQHPDMHGFCGPAFKWVRMTRNVWKKRPRSQKKEKRTRKNEQ